jgi:hypothetical protein
MENLKVNEVTSKGSALHLAVKHNKNYVVSLINHGADP